MHISSSGVMLKLYKAFNLSVYVWSMQLLLGALILKEKLSNWRIYTVSESVSEDLVRNIC